MPVKIYSESRLPTRYGQFRLRCYRDDAGNESIALLSKYFDRDKPVNLRIHSSCITGEVFGSDRCDCREQLDAAINIIANQTGLVIYLLQEGRGIGFGNKVRAYALQDHGYDTEEANLMIGCPVDAREYDAVRDILGDLGIRSVNLITNNPEKVQAIKNFGIEVSARISAVVPTKPDSRSYMRTKQLKFGHLLD